MLSVDDQIAKLRPVLGFAAHTHAWFLVGAAVCVFLAIVLWHPVPLMIAAFLALVGIGSKKTGPNLVAAVRAYEQDAPTNGEVTIAITCWDTDDHYHATVNEQGYVGWTYEFIPHGWKPTTGKYPAKIWRADENGQPLLAVVDEGIMIPRYDPKPIEE